MKTTTLVAILIGASALLFIQPVFAQTDNDSPAEIGSGAWGSTDPVDSDQFIPPSYVASAPSYDENWRDNSALAPAPNLSEVPAPVYSDEATPPLYGAINPSYMNPSYDEPWGGDSALAPAPEQPEASAPESMYVPQGPVGLIERPGLTPISPTSPELLAPDSFARPAGGFDGRIQ
jgi:hypothetical protein